MQHPSLIFALGLLLGEIREPAMTERGSTPAMQPTCEGYERSSPNLRDLGSVITA
jgi:hypothetical protein